MEISYSIFEQLRQVVGLRSYGQRDPLVEYKKEAFDLFSNLLDKLKLDFVTILMNLKVVTEQQEENKKSMVDQIIQNVGKKMVEMNLAHVDLEKNLNIVVELYKI